MCINRAAVVYPCYHIAPSRGILSVLLLSIPAIYPIYSASREEEMNIQPPACAYIEGKSHLRALLLKLLFSFLLCGHWEQCMCQLCATWEFSWSECSLPSS